MTNCLTFFLDPGCFVPHSTADAGELVGGTGMIGGRRVCIITINLEARGPVDAFVVLQQELALLDRAEEQHIPLIYLDVLGCPASRGRFQPYCNNPDVSGC